MDQPESSQKPAKIKTPKMLSSAAAAGQMQINSRPQKVDRKVVLTWSHLWMN